MKPSRFLVAALALCVLVAACSSPTRSATLPQATIQAVRPTSPATAAPPTPSISLTTYSSPDGRFSFQYPEEYVIYVDEKPSVDGVIFPFLNSVTVVSRTSPNFMLSIEQFSLDAPLSLADFLSQDDCVRDPSLGERILIGAETALLFPDTPCGPMGYTLLLLVHNNDVYRVTIETTATFQEVREPAMTVLSTFVATGEGAPPAAGGEYRISCFTGTDSEVCRPAFSVPMNALAFASPDEAWAVGDGGSIFHYEDSRWSLSASPTTHSLNGIWFNTPDDGWVVGDQALILHWDGSEWSIVKETEQGHGFDLSFRGVKFNDPNLGWAVGAAKSEGAGGAIASLWNGDTWIDTPVPALGCWIELVSIMSEDEAIAACHAGGFWATVRWDGSSWTFVDAPDDYLSYRQYFAEVLPRDAFRKLPVDTFDDLEILSDNDIWITAWYDEPLSHWDGVSWKPVRINNGAHISDVAFSPEGNGFILTRSGKLFTITPTGGE